MAERSDYNNRNNNNANNRMPTGNAATSGFRVPTVQEALRYSPFSSIVPFSPDVVPAPLALPTPPANLFLSHEQRASADRMLDHLNQEATGAERASERLQRTVRDLQHLLNPSNLTTYTLKRPSHPVKQGVGAGAAHATKSTRHDPGLQGFAKMVLDATSVHYRYPTPDTPSRLKQEHNPSHPSAPTAQPTTTHHSILERQHATQHPRVKEDAASHKPAPVSAQQTPRPSLPTQGNTAQHVRPHVQPKPQSSQPDVRVVIESTPRQRSANETPVHSAPKATSEDTIPRPSQTVVSRPDNVQVIISAAPNGIKKDTHEPYAGREKEPQLTSASLAQRERGSAAVAKLNSILTDIFEAEDQLQPDTSGAIAAHAARLFIVEDGVETENPKLQPGVQIQLDSALHKVIANARLSSIDVDHLARVQSICENAIDAAGGVNLGLHDDTADDAQEWVQRVGVAEQGLNASKTLLRIMTAGREEKQLYSEDTLRRLMDTLSHVVETCIIPIAELRQSAGSTSTFKFAVSQQKVLMPVVQACTRVLKLLGDLLLKTDVDESAITIAETICKALIFVENATSEKDSVLGVQRFEIVRRAAMDVLAKIFARYTDQRQYIFDEILTSLEKLPVGRQSARQYKMIDSKPIQLVSALLMRLVQTSATWSRVRPGKLSDETGDAATEADESMADAEDASESGSESDYAHGASIKAAKKKQKKSKSKESLGDLHSNVGPLYDASMRNAHYMVNYLLKRAMSSTKTGDEPYRNLLDIFTEDFLSVLGNTDWPAAELLSRTLLTKLLEITEGKGSVPSKAMALELMGSMATRITELRLQAQNAAKNHISEQSEVTSRLFNLHESIINDDMTEAELLAFDGPYRVVLEYLHLRGSDEDSQLRTACGYHVMQWAKQVLNLEQSTRAMEDLQHRLNHMVQDPQWLETEYDSMQVSTEEGRFACVLATLQLPFCRAFNRIFTQLLKSMSGDQASLRSKSLKSIEQLLEMDPSVLDRSSYVMNTILRCLIDTSPQVRDSALGLVSKCLTLRPKIDTLVYEKVIQRSHDATAHVRKKAMKMLKEIYLRNNGLRVRAKIADALIARVVDTEESVAELARQTFEDVWMAPFHLSTRADVDHVKTKLRLRDQTTLIINIVKNKNDSTDAVLPDLLQVLLSERSKTAAANFYVCKQMVNAMFEAIIDPTELPESPAQPLVLQTLTFFAAANAKLFSSDQLQMLTPYIKNLTTDDNLVVYRCAIVILRHALPVTQNLNRDFLSEIQSELIKTFQKLRKAELREVSACLWMLNGELGNTERLVTIVRSILVGIKQLLKVDLNADEKAAQRARRLISIAGQFCKAFDLDAHIEDFRKLVPEFKGHSVSSLAVNVICPFTSPKQPAILREAALEAVCMICQAWPKELMREDVCNAFELVFESKTPELEFILVGGLKEFFAAGDKASDGAIDIPIGAGAATGTDRLGKTYLATDRDGAATSIAQRFLQAVLRVAIASADELALNAAQVVASINRQGLVHPKESGPCFVALETCPDNQIASVAFQEHRALYHKHETMFEKEYMRSVQQAFEYQRDVIKDVLGYAGTPPVAKLHMFWEVLKTGSTKARKKFLSGICVKMDFEPAKLDVSGPVPSHVDMTRFCVENLAFFDYSVLLELQHLVAALEKVVADTGTGVSHAIEVEVLKLDIEKKGEAPIAASEGAVDANLPQVQMQAVVTLPQAIDHSRLRRLTAYAQILLLLWELRTYLRRLWSLSKAQGPGRGRPAKDGIKQDLASRAPQRIPNSSNITERYLVRNVEIMRALGSEASQRALCSTFAELMAVDNELKVDDGDEDMGDTSMTLVDGGADGGAGYETPSEESGRSRSESVMGSAQKKSRKRKSMGEGSHAGTPRKRGKPRKSESFVSRSKTPGLGDDGDDD